MTARSTDLAGLDADADAHWDARSDVRSEANADSELSAAISALRADQGSVEQALALEQRLLTTLGPAAFAGTGAAGGAGGFGAGGWLLALFGFGAALLSPPAAQPEPLRVQVVSEARVQVGASSPTPMLAPAPLASAEPIAPPAPSPRVVRARAPKSVAPARVRPARGPMPMPEAELQLLLRARRLLRRDPSAALTLVEQHAATYPRGVFAQERELLSVEALLRQRARGEAFRRAERFIASHPSSPYAVRLRSMLEQLPRTDDVVGADRALKSSVAP